MHFARGGWTSAEIPLRRLVGGAVVVDVSRKALRNRDYLITPADFAGWERRNGRIKRGSIVLLRTGFERYWPDAEKYLGTAERGEAAVPKLHFPGLSEAGAKWLVRERRIKAVGIDTASIDYGQSTDFLAHRVLGGSNTPIFENVDRPERDALAWIHRGGAADEDRGRHRRTGADHGGDAAVGRREGARIACEV